MLSKGPKTWEAHDAARKASWERPEVDFKEWRLRIDAVIAEYAADRHKWSGHVATAGTQLTDFKRGTVE